MIRNKKFKVVMLALLAFSLFVTTFAAAGPIIGQSISNHSVVSAISFAAPTAVQENQGVLMAWDCPGCPGG